MQDIDSESSKILRSGLLTGAGLMDDPLYSGDAESAYGEVVDSNRAKVYQPGFRNPFRMVFCKVIDDAG